MPGDAAQCQWDSDAKVGDKRVTRMIIYVASTKPEEIVGTLIYPSPEGGTHWTYPMYHSNFLDFADECGLALKLEADPKSVRELKLHPIKGSLELHSLRTPCKHLDFMKKRKEVQGINGE